MSLLPRILQTPLNIGLPLTIQIPTGLVLFILTALALTRIHTTIRYRRALTHYFSGHQTTLTPPPIPYTLPYLGSALAFLAPKPGLFWSSLFRFHPYAAGCCTLRLGGRVAHIIHNPHAVQALFKSRDTSRLEFNINVVRNSFGLGKEDVMKFYGLDAHMRHLEYECEEEDPLEMAERINRDMMLKGESVSELANSFVQFLDEELDSAARGGDVRMYVWVRKVVFQASARALMGEKMLEYYPNFCEEFYEFDRTMLSLFFGIPEFMLREAVRFRERSLNALTRWYDGMEEERLAEVVDPAGEVGWEPNFGSRVNRARQHMYLKLGLSKRGRAGFDLGFMFGLASNAVPATGWMLFHILDPHAPAARLSRVLEELRTVQLPDGTLDINKILALPFLQAIYSEVLRLYSDLLVSRSLNTDIILPLGSKAERNLALNKGALTIAPTWLSHRDPDFWNSPSHELFHPERWLTTDPETGADVFTTAGKAGRFFPFGGGKGMCPGRVFAKQEVFSATALVLLRFEFEVKGFVDDKGRGTEKFPGLREGLGGSGIMVHDGDFRVGIKRRAM